MMLSANVAAVQVNNTMDTHNDIKEVKQLYTFVLKKEVSMSTKRNIMCQYLPNRLQKKEALSAAEQQTLNSIAKEVGKIKNDLNIQCAA